MDTETPHDFASLSFYVGKNLQNIYCAITSTYGEREQKHTYYSASLRKVICVKFCDCFWKKR